ncbi:hypothetical protein CBOM_02623 [Ceraceosorus bombacis]|uniref:Uncharacterized protein n=1 Tax=Ceraceosorus bombacis TaxID=401625 RepID=A0A0P1BFM8_9BASI|nr:hypothetical protein CBOM_02623 [Ceraceosorus bombacis]
MNSRQSADFGTVQQWTRLRDFPPRRLEDRFYTPPDSGGPTSFLEEVLACCRGHTDAKVEGMRADIRTETLVIGFSWGLLLFRPYWYIKVRKRSRLNVAVIAYFDDQDNANFQSACRGMDACDGRVVHSIEHRLSTPSDAPVMNTIFITDLDPSRLDPTKEPAKQPLTDCRVRILKKEPVDEVILDHDYQFVATDVCMDATGVFLRQPTRLDYIDFGLAVDEDSGTSC